MWRLWRARDGGGRDGGEGDARHGTGRERPTGSVDGRVRAASSDVRLAVGRVDRCFEYLFGISLLHLSLCHYSSGGSHVCLALPRCAACGGVLLPGKCLGHATIDARTVGWACSVHRHSPSRQQTHHAQPPFLVGRAQALERPPISHTNNSPRLLQTSCKEVMTPARSAVL